MKPLACWYGFYLMLSFTMICMGVVLRRQWSHHERLAYPMTQLPIGMIEGMDGPLTRIPSFFKNRMMWLGFLLPFSLLSLSGMSHYIPEVPDVPFFLGDLRLFDVVRLEFAFSCAWVGFSYLVHLHVTFSRFFYLLGKAQDGLFHTLGVSSSEPAQPLLLCAVSGPDPPANGSLPDLRALRSVDRAATPAPGVGQGLAQRRDRRFGRGAAVPPFSASLVACSLPESGCGLPVFR